MGSRSDLQRKHTDDQRLLEILEQYLLEQEQGIASDRQKYIAENPDLATRLQECFESMAAVEKLATGIDSNALNLRGRREFPELEDYQVIRELGRGGMGVVYEAEQRSLSRRVALKVLPLAAVFDQKSLQRFKNEALATAQLEHSNIINVYSVGCEKGVHYYAMQLVEGQSLAQVIRFLSGLQPNANKGLRSQSHLDSKPPDIDSETTAEDFANQQTENISDALSAKRAGRPTQYYRSVAKIGLQVANALHHAHQMGVVHRDIKPSNLLLDTRGDVLVSDFGLATMQSEISLTATGDLLGTLKYMSPEQASGQTGLIDNRTDIYSLGATLYELLTCRSVIEGGGKKQVLKNILEEKITAPSKVVQNIPQDLETIVLKALSHDRESRYATGGHMAEDLQRFLSDQPIRAKRPSLKQRAKKWFRRNQWAAITAAICLLLMFAGSVVSSITIYRWYYKADTALKRAHEAESNLKSTNEKLVQAIAVKDSTDKEIRLHAESYFQEARQYYLRQQFREAKTYFQSALKLNEDALQAHLWLSRCYQKLNDVTKTRFHATACIEQLELMSREERQALSFEPWEPYYERAVAGIAKQTPTEAQLVAGKDLRPWDLANLKQAVSDAEIANSIAPEILSLNIVRIKAKFDLAIQMKSEARLQEVGDLAAKLLAKHPHEREVLEVAMIALWKQEKFQKVSQLHKQYLDGQVFPTHGHIYLLRALAQFNNGNTQRGNELFGRGLRWFISRGPVNFHHERFVRNWLVRTAAIQAGRKFDAWEDLYSWTMLKRFRIDSVALHNTASSQPYDTVIVQNNMNNECGPFWTPDYKAFGHPQNGMHLFWQPNGKSTRLRFSLFDTNVIRAKKAADQTPALATAFEPGTHRLTANLTSSNDFAIVQFWWNGKKVGKPIDLYHPKPAQLGETDLGWVEVAEGPNVMEVEIVGRNAKAIGKPSFGIDFIDIWPRDFVPGRTPLSEAGRRMSDATSQAIRAIVNPTKK